MSKIELKHQLLLILFYFLITGSFSMHVNASYHTQAASSQQAYYNKLSDIENQFNKQIQDLELIVNSINNKVSSYEGFTTIQIQALETGLQQERLSIYNIANNMVLPLQLKDWECQMFTQAQQQTIANKINQAQKNLNLLQTKISSEDNCQRNNMIQSQVIYLNLYLDHLNKQLYKNCLPTTVTPPVVKKIKVPNSQNNLYVYGSQGQQGYNAKIQQLLNQGFTKEQCPPNFPYPNQESCVSCPSLKQYYDLTLLKCLQCQAGYVFDPKAQACVIQRMNSNPLATNAQGNILNIDSTLKTCPIQTPFFDGRSCISCSGDQSYFSFKDNICKVCPSNTIFDKNTKMCVYRRFNSNINKDSSNYCCGTVPVQENIDTCPAEKPFFNGQQCIQCKLPAYFNLQSKTCLLCPQGQSYSLIQHNCIDIKYLQPVFRSTLDGAQNYYGNPTTYSQLYQNVQSCPSDRPYVSGSSCVACNLPYYFNFQVGRCESCGQNSKFDLNARKCINIQTQRMNNNLENLDNYLGKIPDYNPQLSTCPAQKPFFNGNQCVACNLPKYADFGTLECKQCNAGFKYNIENHQCNVDPPTHYTDTQAQNIYYNGDFSIITTGVQRIRSLYPRAQKCPSDKPFYNAQTGLCISCQDQYPLFDIKFNRCISCTGISHYDSTQRVCTTRGAVGPTLQRMIMNTVGWV